MVYYSTTNDGKIYKVAIMVSVNQGVRTRMEGALLENFKIEKINRDSYMHADKPNIIIEKNRKYGENNTLTKNHEMALQLLSYNDNSNLILK